eukprot:9513577-Heterocapsa_arctica.AAC.1
MQPGGFRGNRAALVQDASGVRFLRGPKEPREIVRRLHGVDCEPDLERAAADLLRGLLWLGGLGKAGLGGGRRYRRAEA